MNTNRPTFETREDVPEEQQPYAYRFIVGTEEGPVDGDGEPTSLTVWKWTYDTNPADDEVGYVHDADCAMHPANSSGLVGDCTCSPTEVTVNRDEAMAHIYDLIGKKNK